ncbi:hypothetical protein CONCODRAFT_12511 [Conidiobolus coronatus NRRL 28638]|uniref:F-box domain-containing protein n=1 Tax=Conidiobolus coronatus (strain ATCC 28846 / CBS 209.66 / NRRL 28638) TaxID=796925 RepID=A0A137NSV9_CONC2|nr:hypothetical protein CONCODRAFT_12511 [Conidiobolus coronatus NRRL 28638]|eukprot:KXN65806.1 hypothetical protein CONCODRAFT_12511 [Conidiobolus coronatus NRRL 28638]
MNTNSNYDGSGYTIEDFIAILGAWKAKEGANNRDSTINLSNSRSIIWDINIILSKIFSYTDFEDLVEFNTVNKRWNSLINPIIHTNLKVLRSKAIRNKIYSKGLKKSEIIDAEAAECISINSKISHFIKEFTYSKKLSLERTIGFFETFKFITRLNISLVEICINQLLYILKPLFKLQELDITALKIKESPKNTIYESAVQLPPTLKILKLTRINTTNNSELFIQTLNSHTDLVEFNFDTCDRNDYLDPFIKNYPSLKSLKYFSTWLENPQPLCLIAEFNPQLLNLKLEIGVWNNELTTKISRNLVNLRKFALFDSSEFMQNQSLIFLKFFQATNIINLDLHWANLSHCSLNSILANCPNLEELSLIKTVIHSPESTSLSLSIPNSANLRKLSIFCTTLSESSLDSILSNSPNLIELEIQLPEEWEGWANSIGKRLKNLEKLSIYPDDSLEEEGIETFHVDFCYKELIESSSIYKSTLTTLTLNTCNFQETSVNIFDQFKKLKTIQFAVSDSSYISEIDIDYLNDSYWPHYKAIPLYFDETVIGIDLVKIDILS